MVILQSFEPSSTIPPFQGSGQGNGESGTIWATISTVLVNMLRGEGFGAHVMNTVTKDLANIVDFCC